MYQIAHTALIHELLDNEVIVANLDTGIYYSIRFAGVPIWQLCLAGVTHEAIVKTLSTHYERDLTHDIEGFLGMLVSHDILLHDAEKMSSQQPQTVLWPAEYTAPSLEIYEEMKDLLMLDPIHEVDAQGWPAKAP